MIGHRWLSGSAEVLPDDDPGQRLIFILAHFGWLRRLDARALESSIRLLHSDPRVVRIHINEHSRPPPSRVRGQPPVLDDATVQQLPVGADDELVQWLKPG